MDSEFEMRNTYHVGRLVALRDNPSITGTVTQQERKYCSCCYDQVQVMFSDQGRGSGKYYYEQLIPLDEDSGLRHVKVRLSKLQYGTAVVSVFARSEITIEEIQTRMNQRTHQRSDFHMTDNKLFGINASVLAVCFVQDRGAGAMEDTEIEDGTEASDTKNML